MFKELDLLISDIERVANFDFENEVKEIFSQILKVMAIRTIADTNQAKSMITDAVKSKLNIDISDILDSPPNGWGNKNRGEGMGLWMASYGKNNDSFDFEFTGFDWGLANQEYNDIPSKNYPTKNEEYLRKTGRSNTQYMPYHITLTCDQVENGKIASVELKVNKLVQKIINVLEGVR